MAGVWLYDIEDGEWINKPAPQIATFILENSTTVNTGQPASAATPVEKPKVAYVAPAPPAPSEEKTTESDFECLGGDFMVDAWQLESVVKPKGWKVTIYAEGHGGDCNYTYAWDAEDNVKGVVTGGPITFEIHTPQREASIVGTVIVTSGDEIVKAAIYVSSPPK